MIDLSDFDDEVSEDLYCPIENTIMANPVTMDDGYTYEEDNILKYLDENDGRSPITKKKISKKRIKNSAIIKKIKIFLDSIKKKKINVFVTMLNGKTYNFIMKENETILKLKENIRDKEGIKIEFQRLIYEGKNLSYDHSTLKDYGIGNDSTIHLTSRLLG